MNITSTLVSIYAVLLLLAGTILLFVPETVSPGGEAGVLASSLIPQLLGAAFLGIGVANWLARRSLLGGIYGRAVVGGTQAFSFIGCLVLLRGFASDGGAAYWILLAVLSYGALLFSFLLFRGGQPGESPATKA